MAWIGLVSFADRQQAALERLHQRKRWGAELWQAEAFAPRRDFWLLTWQKDSEVNTKPYNFFGYHGQLFRLATCVGCFFNSRRSIRILSDLPAEQPGPRFVFSIRVSLQNGSKPWWKLLQKTPSKEKTRGCSASSPKKLAASPVLISAFDLSKLWRWWGRTRDRWTWLLAEISFEHWGRHPIWSVSTWWFLINTCLGGPWFPLFLIQENTCLGILTDISSWIQDSRNEMPPFLSAALDDACLRCEAKELVEMVRGLCCLGEEIYAKKCV